MDPLSDLLQAKLTAAELKLKRLHLETRAATLAKQMAALTGLAGWIDSARPRKHSGDSRGDGRRSARELLRDRVCADDGRLEAKGSPGRPICAGCSQISFNAIYLRNTTILNDFNAYYNPNKPIPTNNFNAGFSIQIPLFDLGRRQGKGVGCRCAAREGRGRAGQRQNDFRLRH